MKRQNEDEMARHISPWPSVAFLSSAGAMLIGQQLLYEGRVAWSLVAPQRDGQGVHLGLHLSMCSC